MQKNRCSRSSPNSWGAAGGPLIASVSAEDLITQGKPAAPVQLPAHLEQKILPVRRVDHLEEPVLKPLLQLFPRKSEHVKKAVVDRNGGIAFVISALHDPARDQVQQGLPLRAEPFEQSFHIYRLTPPGPRAALTGRRARRLCKMQTVKKWKPPLCSLRGPAPENRRQSA